MKTMSKADKEKEGVLLQKSRSKLSRKIEEGRIERERERSIDKERKKYRIRLRSERKREKD